MAIIDNPVPWIGKTYDLTGLDVLRDSHVPFLIAGGVSLDNVQDIMTSIPFATGIDVASGIRTDGEIDEKKIETLGLITKNLLH